MSLIFSHDGWPDYVYWQTQDKKTLKKLNRLINDINRNGHKGTGKPELLTGNWSGWHSRRIDDKHRLIYRFVNGNLEIAQCREHYES